MTDKTKLVAFFSCSGVTKKLAETIAETVGADLYEITPQIPYTQADLDWRDKKSRSSIEMNDITSRPVIANKVPKMDEYAVVFVGFPIWWYVAPRIIQTFLESYDFSGKTIVPFCTSGSSDVGKSDKNLQCSCSDATKWRPGKRMTREISQDNLLQWIDSLKL
jgi:flavodoxin